MVTLDSYLDDLLALGCAYFSRDEALAALGLKSPALAAAITRSIKKRRLANPRHGFYLILRPEDRIAGAPDPVKWIDPPMKHQGVDYRISLLRAAAFHGKPPWSSRSLFPGSCAISTLAVTACNSFTRRLNHSRKSIRPTW